MKKIILVVLLALSLQSSNVLCVDYTEKYRSSNQMSFYSFQDGDLRQATRWAKKSLRHINRVGSECLTGNEKNDKEFLVAIDKARAAIKARIKEWE